MKKKIKKLVSSVLAFVIAFSALTIIPGNVLHAWYVSAAELVRGETGAEETYQSGSFTYTLVNEYTNVKLLSCSSDAEGLEIPDTIDGKYVTVLGGQTFQSNKTLKSVTLPKRLEVIEDAAFSGCTSLASADFTSSLRSIGRNAFSGATALKTAHFAEGLQTIGTYAFNGCTSLESVVLPSTLGTLASDAFSSCTGMKSAVVNGTNLSVGNYSFEYCYALESITFGEGVKSIGYRTCYQCGKISSLTLPDSLESIGNLAFPNLTATELHLGDSLKSIGSEAFANAKQLKTITIGKSLATIDSTAFSGATALEGITVDADNPNYSDSDGVLMNKDKTALVLFPKSRQGQFIIPDTVTAIGDSTFDGCAGLTSVIVGDSVQTIGTRAFRSCSGLTEVTLGNGLTAIANEAFYGCSKLQKVSFGNSLSTIGEFAFSGCTSLESVDFPSSLRSIGRNAFSGANALKTVRFAEGLQSIGTYAFNGCTSLESVVLPSTLGTLASDAFSSCTGMKSAVVNGTNLAVNSYAFEYCYALESIAFGEGVKSIGYRTCYQCGSLKNIQIANSVETIGSLAFANAKQLDEVVFGSGLTSIAADAFPSDGSFTALCYEDSPAQDYLKAFPNVTVKFIQDNYYVSDLAVGKLSSGEATITWNKPKGYTDIDRYFIYKNGTKIDETDETSYTDVSLTAGEEYLYAVCAVDSRGVVSEKREISVIPACSEVKSLTLPGGKTEIGGTAPIVLTAEMENALSADGAEAVFLCSSDKESWKEIGAASTSDGVTYKGSWPLKDVATGSYTLRFRFTDKNGGVTFRDTEVKVDRTAPAKIDNLTVTPLETTIKLAWQISAEEDTAVYRVYRSESADGGFELLTEIRSRETLNYTDKKAQKDTVYYYYVVGVDAFGQESETYDIASGGLIDDTESPVFVRMTPANMSYIYGRQRFTVTATDNVGVVKTELYYSTNPDAPRDSWSLLVSRSGSSFSETVDTASLPCGELYLVAKIFDAAKNFTYSPQMTYRCDNQGPAQIKNLRCTANLGTQATLAWDDTDDSDKSYFLLEQKQPDGSFKALSTKYTALGANLEKLTPETSYTFRVVAYDIHGNRGTASEPCTFTTVTDKYPPAVTEVTPQPDDAKAYNDKIDFAFTAEDDYALRSAEVKVSVDNKNWTSVKSFDTDGTSKKETFRFTLDLGDYPEGRLYVRFIATDAQGNTLSDDANPAVTYKIDRTPCPVPADVTAETDKDYVSLSWSPVADDSLLGYNVLRSDTKDGTFKTIRSRTKAVSVYDEDVEHGKTYFYQVQTVDIAGNLSELSAPVSCTVEPDTEPPVLYGFSPDDGARISPQNNSISAGASDNAKLERMTLSYKTNALFDSFRTLREVTDNTSRSILLHAQLPLDELSSGTEITLKITAADAAGNEMEEKTVRYLIDKDAPEIRNLSSEHKDGVNKLRWSADADDLQCFCVMRQTAEDGEFQYVKKVNATSGGSYSFDDTDIGKHTYFKYRVIAYDTLNNTSTADSESLTIENYQNPSAVLDVPPFVVFGSEYRYLGGNSVEGTAKIVRYTFDFGDGTEPVSAAGSSATHVYEKEGAYTLTLTVTDENGKTDSISETVNVTSRELVGVTPVRVLDENLSPVYQAEVYLDLGTDRESSFKTDSAGSVTVESGLGTHTFAAYKDGYLPAKLTAAVTGDGSEVVLVIQKQEIVTGQFEIHKMTFDEIKAAGIKLGDESNWRTNIVEYKVTLEYEKKPIKDAFYFDGKNIIGGGPIVITLPTGERQLTPTVIDSDGTGRNPLIAYIDVPVHMQYSTLKDFFDVKLHILNHASAQFSLDDSSVRLNLPRGLSIAQTALSDASAAAAVSLGSIAGGTGRTVRWIVRGDEAGEYTISADFCGTLSRFNKPIQATFISDEKIVVSDSFPLKAEIQASKGNFNSKVFYNLVIENTGSAPVKDIKFLGDSAGFTEGAYCVDLIGSDGGATELEKPVTTLKGGEKLVYYFYTPVSRYARFKSSAIKAVSGEGLDITVNLYDTDFFTKKYKKKHPEETDSFIFTITDKDGEPIEGAKVDLGDGQIFYSDKDGKAVIDEDTKPDINCRYVRITRDGFLPFSSDALRGKLLSRGFDVTLYRKGEFEITNVLAAGTSVLYSYHSIVTDAKDSDGKPAAVRITALCAGEPATAFVLAQDGKQIKPLSDSYDEENNTYEAVFSVDSFTAGKETTGAGITLTAKTANTEKTVSLNLNTLEKGELKPLPVPDYESFSFLNAPDWLYPAEFDFAFPGPFKLHFSHDAIEQKFVYVFTCSTDLNGADDIMKFLNTTEYDSIKDFIKADKGKRSGTTDYPSGKDIQATVSLVFEESYKTGELVLTKGAIISSFGVSYSIYQVFDAVVPITLSETFSLSASSEMGISSEYKALTEGFLLGLEFGLKINAGVGIPYASAGVFGEGKLNVTTLISPWAVKEFTGTGRVGLYLQLAWYYDEITLLEGRIKFYENENVGALFNTDNYKLNTGLLTRGTAWDAPAGLPEGTATLIENADASEAPKTVTVDGKTVMVYRGVDKSSDTVANALALYYSVRDDASGKWSVPKKVDDNHLSDLSFSLASDGAGAQLVYAQANRELSDGMTMKDMFSSVDIYASAFNVQTGAFEPAVRLTDNTAYDACPAVSYSGGKPTAVWLSNSAANPLFTDSSNALLFSRYENGSWSAPGAVTENSGTILNCRAIGSSVVFTKDADSDLATSGDRSLYLYDMATGSVKTLAEGIVSAVETGTLRSRDVVMWYQDGKLTSYDIAGGTVSALCDVSGALAAGFRLLESDGTASVVFQSEDNRLSQICLDNETGAWSSPVTVAEANGNIRSFEAAYTGGTLNLTYYVDTETENGRQSDLVNTSVARKPQPVISDPIVDYTSIHKGEEASMLVRVRNNGVLPTGNLIFEMTDYDGKTLSAFTAPDSSLSAGESRLFTVPFTSPDEIESRDLRLTVCDATRSSSDSYSFNPAVADLKLSCNQYNNNGESYLYAVITNRTDYSTPAALEVFDPETGAVYAEVNISEVSSDCPATVMLPVSRKLTDANGYVHARVISRVTDCIMSNNEDFFVYNRIRSIKGDVNGDEEITISDVTLLQQYLADLETLDALGLAAADANGDGIINISDATHIQKYIAEIITEM